MRIHNRHDIARACADEPASYASNCVHVFDVDGEPHAVATDGKILALVPAWMSHDDMRGTYAREAFTIARDQFLASIGDEFPAGDGPDLRHPQMCYGFELRDNGRAGIGMTEVRTAALEWSKPVTMKMVQAVVEKAKAAKRTVAIDVDLLLRLADAIGTRKLTLRVGDYDDVPIEVRSQSEENGARGFLMPMRLDAPAPHEVAERIDAMLDEPIIPIGAPKEPTR